VLTSKVVTHNVRDVLRDQRDIHFVDEIAACAICSDSFG